jgi:hypothetical protein
MAHELMVGAFVRVATRVLALVAIPMRARLWSFVSPS